MIVLLKKNSMMPILKPYKLIWRPNKKNSFTMASDPIYSSDRYLFLNAYYLLENDLKKIFEYVYPSSNNKDTYSHRIYELLLRASTEFESNSKSILKANGYSMSGHLNITDYYKLNASSKLSDYEIKINIWDTTPLIIKPFDEWNTSHTLTWYKEYNLVKHDRHENFQKANFLNLINAVGATFIILYSQFDFQAINQNNSSSSLNYDNDRFASINNNLFSIKAPQWLDSEYYDFTWDTIKSTSNPFDNFTF